MENLIAAHLELMKNVSRSLEEVVPF